MLRAVVTRVIAVVLALAGATSLAEARSLDDMIKAGVIRIGVNPNFPPNSSYNDKNELEGFDIDVGNKIAEALKLKVEWVPTETPQRVPFLVSDKIDISLGALTRNSERAKLIDLHRAAAHRGHGGADHRQGPAIDKWTDLERPKYTLANMRGNWSVDYLKGELPNAKVELVDTIADTVRLVAQGRADAIVENIDFFMEHTKNYPDVKWVVLPDPIDVGYCAIGVQLGNYPLAGRAEHHALQTALAPTTSTRRGRSGMARRCW